MIRWAIFNYIYVIIKHASYEFVLNFADELAQLQQQLREWGALTHERHEQVAAGSKDSFMLNAMGKRGDVRSVGGCFAQNSIS